MEKKYTKADIFNILDIAKKEAMQRKNRYIELNGYNHKDTLDRFDTEIAAISYLYSRFER